MPGECSTSIPGWRRSGLLRSRSEPEGSWLRRASSADPSCKPFLGLGVVLMGAGFLAAGAFTTLVPVSLACASAVAGFGLVSTLGFSLFASLTPRGEAGGYTALCYSLRAAASAIAVPVAGLTIVARGSYRSLFLLGGAATLAALVPLSVAPSPEQGAALTRELA